jgi:lipopolysaccharide heptosyltransferase I
MHPHKILIVKPSSLGDVVHSLPVLNALATCFPEAKIHWVVARGFEGLLEGHPMIHKLWVIKKDSWKKVLNARHTIQEVSLLFRQLKQEKYDLVIDLQGLLRSGLITSATGSRVRIGFKEAREGSRVFYTDTVEGGKNIHAVLRYLKIVGYLGCDISDIRFPFPSIEKSSFFILHPSSFLSIDRYAVLVPGARWKTKRWPAEQFGRLASLMSINTFIVGSKSDIATADQIVSLSHGKAVSLSGKTTLKDLIEIMKQAQFVVSNDSGPMHIAAALGIPVFAIFGPTDPARTGPFGKGHTIIRSDLSCVPCFRRSCDDMKCMKSISADQVYKIIASKQHVREFSNDNAIEL